MMVKTKQSNKEKERVSLYINSAKIKKAKMAAAEMDVPLSFVIEDILGMFLTRLEKKYGTDSKIEMSLEDYYRWKFEEIKNENNKR